MKEIHEFRIFKDYYHLLPTNKAKFNGMVYVLKILNDDPLFQQIGILDKELRKKHSKALFSFWDVSRNYTKKEFADANIFHFNIKSHHISANFNLFGVIGITDKGSP